MKHILIVGECGVGKTWIMKKLLGGENKAYKLGLFLFHEFKNYIVVGKYDGTTFEGSDKLSMGVMKDINKIEKYLSKVNKIGFFEGDRFMNRNFIKKIQPLILKINGDGKQGREKRGSKQTERQLKTIKTRVSNIKEDMSFNNSTECYEYIKNQIL